MNSIYDEFAVIFKQQDLWFRFENRKFMPETELTIDNLFIPNISNNFIKNVFFHEGYSALIPKVQFPDCREEHTVSAFFLGLYLKDKLKLSVRSIPRVCGDYKKSFIYFWSMICLAHDITYRIENDVKNYRNLETIYRKFDVKYYLLKDSDIGDVLQKYFDLRLEENECLDHGITCGIVLYNLLMRQYHEKQELLKQGTLMIGEHWKFNKNFPQHALKIAETIARHNIWVAKGESEEEKYRKYGLEVLCGSDVRFQKVAYSEKDSLLFLLGLVDTLEPLKCSGKLGVGEPYNILKNIEIRCSSKNKNISIKPNGEIEPARLENWKNMEDWLELSVITDGDIVNISFEYERAENTKKIA